MRTLIINGSPRKHGGTADMVSMLSGRLPGEIEVISTYYCGTQPCIDCRYCWTHAGCALEDDMRRIYREIDRADAIVIASPIYFAQLTGSLLQWASRLQYLWVSDKFRGTPALSDRPRRGGALLVDGGDGYCDEALSMAKRLLRCMGAQFCGHAYFSGTDKSESTLPSGSGQTAREIESLALRLLGK